jgi:hypothetical protein
MSTLPPNELYPRMTPDAFFSIHDNISLALIYGRINGQNRRLSLASRRGPFKSVSYSVFTKHWEVCYIQSIDWQVRPSAQLLHPPGAGSQRPHEPPRARGQTAALVIVGLEAVTVTVYVAVLVLLGVVPGLVTVTRTVEVEVDRGLTMTGIAVIVPIKLLRYLGFLNPGSAMCILVIVTITCCIKDSRLVWCIF